MNIPMASFGKDHWNMLLYLESCTVDKRGKIDADKLRCNQHKRPYHLGTRQRGHFNYNGAKYPTRLAQGVELQAHDDWDCLFDLEAAGLVTIERMADGEAWVASEREMDPEFHAERNAAGEPLVPPRHYWSGMMELQVQGYKDRHATVSLTPEGQRHAAALRANRAAGGNDGTYAPLAVIS